MKLATFFLLTELSSANDHPRVLANVNHIQLDVFGNAEIFTGSEYQASKVIVDTMSQWTIINNLELSKTL